MGMQSWDQHIPYTVTNSTITAQYHAELIIQNTSQDIGIIDFGAGIGQHGFLLAKALCKLCKKHNRDIKDFTIYLADISQDCLSAWQRSHQIAPFIDSGLIKPILLTGNWLADIDTATSLPHTTQVVIANYLLDSMPFQAFHYDQAQGIALASPRKFLTPDFSGPLEALALSTRPLGPSKHPLSHRYKHLERYTIPTCAITFIKSFFEHSPNGLFIINDKANLSIDSFNLDEHYNLNLEGNFSSTVNIDAITQSIDQHSYYISNNAPNLKTVVYSQHRLNIPDALCASDLPLMIEHLKHTENISQALAQTICKTLHHDPFCLEILSQSISPGTPSEELLAHLTQCYENHLDNRPSFTHLHLAKIYYKTGLYDQARTHLDTYKASFGEDGAFLLETAQYHLCTNNKSLALEYAKRALLDKKITESAKKLINIIKESAILKEN